MYYYYYIDMEVIASGPGVTSAIHNFSTEVESYGNHSNSINLPNLTIVEFSPKFVEINQGPNLPVMTKQLLKNKCYNVPIARYVSSDLRITWNDFLVRLNDMHPNILVSCHVIGTTSLLEVIFIFLRNVNLYCFQGCRISKTWNDGFNPNKSFKADSDITTYQ
jgi:hypothetical protein